MAQPHQGRPNPQRRDETPRQQTDAAWLNRIRFGEKLDSEIFNSIAKQAAEIIAGDNDRVNKHSQLRRFYDELCMWEEKVSRQPDKFDEYLPFIRMLNAKAAYAEGRNPKLVDQNFVNLLRHTLSEVKDAKTMTTCKLFWEAFMGFYKQYRQS
jgi:CRISPR-associated protein Csm2